MHNMALFCFLLISVGRDTVVLNVGGTLHQVRWETIEKFPKSRLHCLRFAITEGNLIYL